MKKKDLKTGMLAKTRDGDWWFIARDITNECENDILVQIELPYRSFNPLSDYNEDLENTYCGNEEDRDYDIISVANCRYCFEFFTKETSDEFVRSLDGFEIIWEREKKKSSEIKVKVSTEIDEDSINSIKTEIIKLQGLLNDLSIKLSIKS